MELVNQNPKIDKVKAKLSKEILTPKCDTNFYVVLYLFIKCNC